ncbi:MAG: type II toxin-antitoxin system HicB family antitoxin [Fibromonadaceae bacterium]|jgi:DNA-binding phage protein|nr:type II toxin-antitoxin system HicB family antitoxin [Fibromonadaceae bacterium]
MNYAAKITKEDDEYIVSFPDKPNINTCGESLEHSLEMAKEALNETLICELNLCKHLVAPKTKENLKKGLHAIPVKPEIEIAYMLFEARKGKPIAKVAKEAGISKQAYRSFETPFANPTFNALSSIAKALGKNLEIRLI